MKKAIRVFATTLFCVGLMLAHTQFANAQDVLRIETAEVALNQGKEIHDFKDIQEDAWQKVSLPYKPVRDPLLNPVNPEQASWLWFRMPLGELDSESLQAIYIIHHAFDIEVYVDSYLLGEKKGPDNLYAMGWNIPLLFTIPEYLRAQQPEMLVIKLRQAEIFTFLPEIYIGKSAVLQQRYQQRYFLQVKAAEWGWVASILLGVFSFFLWLKRFDDKQYLQFSVLCFSWSVVLLYMFLPYSPVSPQLWLKIGYASAEFAGMAMFFFINSMMNFRHKLLEKILVSIMLMLIVVYFSLPLNQVFYLVTFAHALVWLFVVYALGKTMRIAFRSKHASARTISIGGAWVVMFIAYDIVSFGLSYQKNIALPEFTIMQHGFLFLLITFFILLIQRFLSAIKNSEDLNNTLAEKIATITEELEKSYADSRQLEILHSTERERQNIMRDLHDDIGAKLISITSSTNSAEQAELGREALISMKDIVSQSNRLSNDINSTVIIATTEMEARFDSANIKVEIEADKTLDEILVPPQTCYHLSRILREITTNIIKHSKATQVTIKYQFSDSLIYEIKDNGVGMDIANNVGNGLRNIQFRLNAINGTIRMTSAHQQGLQIVLSIPLERE